MTQTKDHNNVSVTYPKDMEFSDFDKKKKKINSDK